MKSQSASKRSALKLCDMCVCVCFGLFELCGWIFCPTEVFCFAPGNVFITEI